MMALGFIFNHRGEMATRELLICKKSRMGVPKAL